VRGIFQSFRKGEYRGKRYGTLVDPNDRQSKLTIRVARAHVEHLIGKEGQVFTFSGSVFWDPKPEFGRAELVFEVGHVEGIEEPSSLYEEKIKILNLILEKEKKDVEGILRGKLENGESPRIAVVVGETAIIQKDILSALGSKKDRYELTFRKVNLTREEELTSLMHELDGENYDAIALARGGGEGLDVFNSLSLAKSLCDLRKPLITALGHAQNRHLIDEIADRSFATPTAFGQFLHQLAGSIGEVRELREKARELERDLKKLEAEKIILERKLSELSLKERIYAGLIFLLLLVLTGGAVLFFL
jgi:hypothetical protein